MPKPAKARSEAAAANRHADQAHTWLVEYGDRLFAYAMARVSDQTVAEEMVQETFLAALKNLEQFAGQSSAATWLTGILRHKIHDYYRRQRRRDQPLGPLSEGFSSDATGFERSSPKRWPADPARAFEDKEFWKVFDECRNHMPAHLADAFVLREIDQLDTDEVCKILDITATNLGVRIHRARVLLRKCLEDRWFAQD